MFSVEENHMPMACGGTNQCVYEGLRRPAGLECRDKEHCKPCILRVKQGPDTQDLFIYVKEFRLP